MVFSRSAPLGRARVVRCSHTITSADDLNTEGAASVGSEELSENTGRIANERWGCVALLRNPRREIPEDLLRAWAQRVEQEQGYGNVRQLAAEGSLISHNGMLQIEWPRCVAGGAPVDLDLLLPRTSFQKCDPETVGLGGLCRLDQVVYAVIY